MRDINFDRSGLSPRVYKDSERDLNCEEYGDDLLIVVEVSMIEHVRKQFKESFLVKPANIISWVP